MNKRQAQEREWMFNRLAAIGINRQDADRLRRASMTLRRWSELKCGKRNNYASWAVEEDKETGKPFLVTYPHDGKSFSQPIPDREKGALKRIARILQDAECTSGNELYYHHQTDPRGCALYVHTEPLTDSDYTKGLAVG